MNQRVCIFCNSNITLKNKDNYPIWRNVDNNPCCHKCYNKKIVSPTTKTKWNNKRLKYKGKHISLKEKKLSNTCYICKKSVGDSYVNCKGKILQIGYTTLHHIIYHDDDPLKDTIEVCATCHQKIHAKKIDLNEIKQSMP